MLATCSNILQIWDGQDYSLENEFGRDHIPKTDTIKSIDWKKDNCKINIYFILKFYLNFLANYLVFTYKQTGRVQLYDIQKNKSVELSTVTTNKLF